MSGEVRQGWGQGWRGGGEDRGWGQEVRVRVGRGGEVRFTSHHVACGLSFECPCFLKVYGSCAFAEKHCKIKKFRGFQKNRTKE